MYVMHNEHEFVHRNHGRKPAKKLQRRRRKGDDKMEFAIRVLWSELSLCSSG